MDVQALRQFIASKPGTFGQHISRNAALNMVADGRTDAVAALVSLVGIEVIPALIAVGASPEVRRAAINAAMFFHYRELPALIEANGGRAVFADWCRGAGFEGSAGLPETVDIYRGTHGCSAAAAVTGLHWTLEFDKAAFYGVQYADDDLTGVIVVHAKVPRDDLVGFMTGGIASEVIPAAVPTDYETITDKDRILDGAVRFSDCRQGLLAKGWKVIPTHGTAERVASEARARMQAAGVPRGTAIVG